MDIGTNGATAGQVDHILWETYLKRGQQALRMHNASEAHRLFAIAAEKIADEDDWRQLETVRWMALASIGSKQYQTASELLSKLLVVLFAKCGADSPQLLDALRLLADLCEKQHKYSQSAKLLLHVLEHHPKKNVCRSDADYIAVRKKFYEMKQRAEELDGMDDRNDPFFYAGRS